MLLAHFVGDFVLQLDKIHTLKFKNSFGLLLHVAIVVGCYTAFCWPYAGNLSFWAFLLFVSTSHYLQDWAKIKFTSGSKYEFLFYLLDQALHVLFISAIFFTDLKLEYGPLNRDKSVLLALYNWDELVIFLIAIIVVSYTAHYAILAFKKDYLKTKPKITPFEKRYGFIERIIILSAFFSGNLWLLVTPLVLSIRIILAKTLKKRLRISKEFDSETEIILSGAASILTALVFTMFI